MNGYLQRLVAGRLNPTSSIHPIVGSFFSAPRHNQTPESPREEEHLQDFREERSIPYPDRTEESAAPLSGAKAGPADSKGPDLRRSTLLPEPTIGKGQSPHVERTLNAVVERLMEPRGTTEQRESVKESVPQTIPEMQRFDAISAGRITQLIAGTVSPSKPKNPLRDRLYPFATEPKLRSAEREPEEIQIHIGRIEVTAVQPAPAIPPAPKSRRVAPSLDEYLRRRDRRTQ